ncbi:MAG TPA: cytochrome C [Halieaceae bacterium]|nr:cytochrome C [Halieaceae bacterium]
MKLSQKLVALVLAVSALSASSLADDAYQTHCASCHGTTGAGNPSLGAPNLTLFSSAYLERQLRGFREGWRDTTDPSTQTMSAAVGALDAGVVADAVLAIDRLPDSRKISVAKPAAGDTDRGADLYTAYCGACHGTNAGGNDALGAPNLLGLDALYLARQYRHFSEGRRGFHADDRYGKQMNRLSRSLKDPSLIDDVSAYVAQLSQ